MFTEILCPTLETLDNIRISSISRRIGDVITLTCPIAYRLRDEIPENYLCM